MGEGGNGISEAMGTTRAEILQILQNILQQKKAPKGGAQKVGVGTITNLLSYYLSFIMLNHTATIV